MLNKSGMMSFKNRSVTQEKRTQRLFWMLRKTSNMFWKQINEPAIEFCALIYLTGGTSVHFPSTFASKHTVDPVLHRMINPVVSLESTGRGKIKPLHLIINLCRYLSQIKSCSHFIHHCPHISSYSLPRLSFWWVLDDGTREMWEVATEHKRGTN